MATLLLLIGCLISLVSGIVILVEAFKTHILWGLGSLFIPIVALVFVLVHWNRAGKAFLVNLLGGFLIFMARVMGA